MTFTIALLVATAVLNFGHLLGLEGGIGAILTVLVGLAFVLAHGSAALGWRNLIAFLIITVVVSFLAEAVGVATGVVFGPYYYTDKLGPKLLGVPLAVQGAYVTMGYASLLTARVLLGVAGTARRGALLAVSVVGAFVMVAWDVAMDPIRSTVLGDWIWPTGGPYFGVGIHNYVGWFGTVFTFMLLYQLYASRSAESPRAGVTHTKLFWSQPVLYYALIGLGIVVTPLVGGVSLPYASPENYAGTLDALVYSLALVAFFAMGTPAAAALARLWVSDTAGRPPV